MTEQDILIERRGPIGTITLNRPERRNAVRYDGWLALAAAVGELGADPAIRAVILRGAAAKREVERDQRHRVLLDEPCLDPGRTDDAFDGGGFGGGRQHQRSREREGGGEEAARMTRLMALAGGRLHERFSGAGSSLTR